MTFMSAILQMAEFLESMEPHVRARGWDRMEAQGRGACVRLTGAPAATEIEAVSLSRYEGQLRSGLKRAVKRAAKLGALAVYFEYDLDNGWDGNFFLCREYVPQAGVEEADEGEDWASDWIEYVAGPAQPKLAAIYAAQRGFSETPEQVGRTAFLVARTVAAFGRASEGLDTQGLAVCVAFHDGEPIFRIQELASLGGPSARAEAERAVSGPQFWKVNPRGKSMASGPATFDKFAVPEPGEVVFTLRDGQLTDYLFNTFGWRLCSESLMRLLEAEKSPGDDVDWIPVQVDAGTKRQRYFLLRANPKPDLLHRTTISSQSGHPIKPILDSALAKEHRVFLLDELGVSIILAEEVKQKIKSAKLSGMYFHPMPTAD
jgi:hypothetical protein